MRVNCHFPITVRVAGSPTDAQLEELAGALTRTLVARMAAAEEQVTRSGATPRVAQRPSVLRVPFDTTRQDPLARHYRLPSFQGGDAAVEVHATATAPRSVRRAALRRIDELLSTGLFDWRVSDAEAREVLHIMEALDPQSLLATVQTMRLTGTWNTFRRELPEGDRQALVDLELKIDPNAGVIARDDTIRLEVFADGHLESALSQDYTVSADGVTLPFLSSPVAVVGLLPTAAANAIAQAYLDQLLLVSPRVRLTVARRGGRYAPRDGPTALVWFESTVQPQGGVAGERRDRWRNYNLYIAGIRPSDPSTVAALQRYLSWVEDNYSGQEFLTRAPEDLWRWAVSTPARRPRASPVQPYLELLQSMSASAEHAPPQERARIHSAVRRYLNWIDAHREAGRIDQYDPVRVWARAYVGAVQEEMREVEARVAREALERAANPPIDWEKAVQRFDQSLRLMITRVWRLPEPRTVEARSERFGYLIMASETERQVRDEIARAFMNEVVERMANADLGTGSAEADFTDWLARHPGAHQALLLAQAYPYAERYEIVIDVPAWQTAIEVVIGFIPIVGQVVGAVEVISGQDLFGNPLSTTDRTILGVAILLPAAARIFRVGRAAVTTAKIAREYQLSAREADAFFRATAQISPGSAGERLLTRAKEDIVAGRSVREPERLRQVETLMRDMGLTDRETAQAVRRPGGTVEREVAGPRLPAPSGGAVPAAARPLRRVDVGPEDLAAMRERYGLTPDQDTLALGKTDASGLEQRTFEGASRRIRETAAVPQPAQRIVSPRTGPHFTEHAEQDVANAFLDAVEEAGLHPHELEGRTLAIHISHPAGVCTACRQGLTGAVVEPGVLMQLSLRYPGLTIRITWEGADRRQRGMIIVTGEILFRW